MFVSSIDGHLCNEDLDNLKLWNPNPNLTPDMALKLTPEGAEDSKLFGSRLQSNFPEILQPNVADITADNYKVRNEKKNSIKKRSREEFCYVYFFFRFSIIKLFFRICSSEAQIRNAPVRAWNHLWREFSGAKMRFGRSMLPVRTTIC